MVVAVTELLVLPHQTHVAGNSSAGPELPHCPITGPAFRDGRESIQASKLKCRNLQLQSPPSPPPLLPPRPATDPALVDAHQHAVHESDAQGGRQPLTDRREGPG